jgi:transcriptional regulator with XRE-family HTH domain
MKNIVKELEKYRLENRISQQKLAFELDVAFCTVNRWFKNRNEPNQIQEYHINKLLEIKRRKTKNDKDTGRTH